MGKSTPPKSGQNPLRRGIAAYQRTVNQPGDSPEVPPTPAKDDPGLRKTIEPEKQAPLFGQGLGKLPVKPAKPGEPPESKYRRVAKFLILIGGDQAAAILAALEPDQVEEISREIAAIRGITAEEAEDIFAEFRSLLESSYGFSGGGSGGVEEARRLLYAVYGPEKGEALLRRSVPDIKDNSFNFLEDFSGEQVAMLLREESPAASALILSRLSPELSAAVLANTLPERKLEIVKRIAHLGQTTPEVIERVAEALREKARHIAAVGKGGDSAEVDGMGVLTAILKHADVSFGDRLLAELDDDAPDISRDLKDRLYTLDDLPNAEDRPIQAKLRSMDDKDIALLLKGRSAEFTAKILSNVSANRRSLIREEGDLMGAVPRIDADAAARDFLAWFRLSLEQGSMLLLNDKDVIV
jgi:flagellar motor switch protein FliG